MKEKIRLLEKTSELYLYRVNNIKDKEELFKIVAQEAEKLGLVKNSYLNALITREMNYPTGIVASTGIAMPHADLKHSKKNGVLTVVSEMPIEFTLMGTQDNRIDVQVIFFLISVDNNHHMKQISYLMKTIEDSEKLQVLRNKAGNSSIE